MNIEERNSITTNFLLAVQKTLEEKGAAYCGTENVWGNFERIAAASGQSVEQVIVVFLCKHLDAVFRVVREPKHRDVEDIYHRLGDAVAYLAILHARLVAERTLHRQAVLKVS